MIKILDTTLRDGSYVVDFQFSQEDTVNISQTLENFDLEFIEIGHGLGLGAYKLEEYDSLCNDFEYMNCINRKKESTKYGVFFIPEIGNFKDIDLAKECNMDFIRIGVNINEPDKAFKYVEYAKKKGFIVFINFMKSYAVSSDKFAQISKEFSIKGVDYIYLVDSAGGMLPNDVKEYISKTKENCNCEIGFHGHNNLTLAIANSLAAIEAGATIIDTSLQGIGRDGGNASTEVLLSILMKQKLKSKINLNALLDYSEVNIFPLVRNTVKTLPLISGLSFFHSGFYSKIKKLIGEIKIDIREVIFELSKINVIEPTKEDILKAIQIVKNSNKELMISTYKNVRKSLTNTNCETIDFLLREIQSLAKKQNKKSVFNVVTTDTENIFISNHIQIGSLYIIGSMQIKSFSELEETIHKIDGMVDIILFDTQIKSENSLLIKEQILKNTKKSKLYFYNDLEIWTKSIENIILEKSISTSPKVYISNHTYLGIKIINRIKDLGFNIISRLDKNIKFDFIIGTSNKEIDISFIDNISDKTIVVDAKIGSITNAILDYCFANDIKVQRTDMRVVLETEILQKEKSYELYTKVQGSKNYHNCTIVAGGIYGKYGDIIVDSIENPSCVIGLSNGDGKVKYNLNDEENMKIEKFKKYIREKK